MKENHFWKEQLWEKYCEQHGITNKNSREYKKILTAFMVGISIGERHSNKAEYDTV